MADQGREVRSPQSTRRGSPDDQARRGEIRHGGPYNPRADSGLGKGPVPVQGQTVGVMQDRGKRF